MSTSTAISIEKLHVATVREGKIWHCTRDLNGAWSTWDQIEALESHEFEEVACSASGSALHVVARDKSGTYWHDIRRPDGTWQGLVKIPDQSLLRG